MANDKLAYAKDVYEANHPETDYRLGDVQKIRTFPAADLLVGCYPCQGFSQGGVRDPSRRINTLYLEFARALTQMKPKAFIVENVSGMVRTDYRHLLLDQIKIFSEIGYDVNFALLNAADFGVAQERKRILLIVGTRVDLNADFQFPDPTHGEGRSRRTFLFAMPCATCVIGRQRTSTTGETSTGTTSHATADAVGTRCRKPLWPTHATCL